MSEMRKSDTKDLTLLGNQNTKYKYEYDPDVLETFENKHPENDYVVTFDAKMVISYIPNKKMVESKSLKLYLFSFRNTGEFHEDCVNTIMKDLVKLMEPKYLEVRGIFAPRGGIAIFPLATYANPDFDFQDLEKQRQLDVIRDGANRTARYDFC